MRLLHKLLIVAIVSISSNLFATEILVRLPEEKKNRKTTLSILKKYDCFYLNQKVEFNGNFDSVFILNFDSIAASNIKSNSVLNLKFVSKVGSDCFLISVSNFFETNVLEINFVSFYKQINLYLMQIKIKQKGFYSRFICDKTVGKFCFFYKQECF